MIALLIAIVLFFDRKPNEVFSASTRKAPGQTAYEPASQAPLLPEPPLSEGKNEPIAGIEEKQKAFLAAFRAPIVFYGKVVDQNGHPVEGAAVAVSANGNGKENALNDSRRTDADGLFSIQGLSGLSLSIWVSRNGYKVMRKDHSGAASSSGMFNYGLAPTHKPEREAPVVFILHKEGTIEALVSVSRRSFRIARDGSPLVVSFGEHETRHHVVFTCWNSELDRPAGQRQYDWKLEIEVSDGGLLERNDRLLFDAPENGYRKSYVINMLSTLPRSEWRSSVEKSFFVSFDDKTFARFDIEMVAGGDHFLRFESFFNPKVGSRHLETASGRTRFVRKPE